jgi:hypothetical protein
MQVIANTKIEIFCGFLSATLPSSARPMAGPLCDEVAMNADESITDIESEEYEAHQDGVRKFPRWIKVAGITAASVLAGGFAATWIYRKSIARLQYPEDAPEYSNFGISGGEADDEI